jgi:hypothetical protein
MQKEVIPEQDPEGSFWTYEEEQAEDWRKYHEE